jgi:cob(I)alamin adenosyltransferase
MSIVTKTGDQGMTGLYGVRRLSKDDPRIEAYGTIDELNALLGVVLAEPTLPPLIAAGMTRVQHQLFRVGADLATPMEAAATTHRVRMDHVSDLERWIASLERELPQLQWFVLPGGSKCGAMLHHARTVCRRAERRIVTLSKSEEVNPQVIIFVNRLGDLLYLLAREANRHADAVDTKVMYE